MKNKNLLITSLITILAILAVIGASYAYMNGSVSNENKQKINANVGNLVLTYNDCADSKKDDCANLSASLAPGESISKTFVVNNDSTINTAITYNILFTSSTNTFVNDDLVYTLTKGSTDVVKDAVVPSGDKTNTSIYSSTIAKGVTDTYTLKVTFKNTDVDQGPNTNATFSIKLGINTSYHS